MFFSNSFTKRKSSVFAQSRAGFTLIELLVCISIVSIVSAVILVRQSSFNGAVLLRNQSYELAFALRKAQLLAVSGTDATDRQYGIYIDRAKPNEYLLFRDDSNAGSNAGQYDNNGIAPDDAIIGLVGRLDKRFYIRGVTNGAGTSLTTTGFSITFVRPNFDAKFKDASGGVVSAATYIDIGVVGKSPTDNSSGAVRRVEVTPAGQISVVTF